MLWQTLSNSLSTLKSGRQHIAQTLLSTWIFYELELDPNNLIMINNNIMLQDLIYQDLSLLIPTTHKKDMYANMWNC